MRFGLTSLAILAGFLGIATAASHRGRRDLPESVQVAANEIEENVCVSQECYDTASRIKKSMDFAVNPCDDFYKFTCGRFGENEIVPSDTYLLNSMYTVNKQFYAQLKNLLEADIAADDIGPFKQAKILYKSCIDVDAIEAAGPRPLNESLKILGGWPVVQGASWNESNFDWMSTIAKWARAGLRPNCFMKIGIGTDTRNNTQQALVLNHPSWFIRSNDLSQGFGGTEAMRAYYKLMVNIAVTLGTDRKQAEDELKEALLFQIELNAIIVETKSNGVRTTVKDLIEVYPEIKWKDTFEKMYSPIETIRDNDTVIVRAPDYIEKVVALISKTPKRVQANFAMFQIIPIMGVYTNREILKNLTDYQSLDLFGLTPAPRWSTCIGDVGDTMPLSVLAMYERKFFTSETKAEIDDMIQQIRGQFRADIDKVSFMDVLTRWFTKKKEKATKVLVGYPMDSLDNDKLEDYYRDLPLFNNNMFSNWLAYMKFKYERTVRNFRKPINTLDLETVIRALMDRYVMARPDLNTVLFPAEIIQGDYFHPERPRYINYATFGTTFGHEIIHLFSGRGSKYDQYGNLRDWWTSITKAAFKQRAECFIDQYGNYIEESLHQSMNGELTLNENIADNGGLKHAYHAYVNSMRDKTPEKRLPGLDYSAKQMFWIAYGNSYCEKFTPDFLKYIWGQEVHGIGRFRVIGTVMNMEEFSNDFGCSVGSIMNPAGDRCSMW